MAENRSIPLAPFAICIRESRTLRSIVSEIIDSAFKRQKETSKLGIASLVLHHLVRAYLEIAFPKAHIDERMLTVHSGVQERRYLVHNTPIFVATAPWDVVLAECVSDSGDGYFPLIISTREGVNGFIGIMRHKGIDSEIEVVDISDFIVTKLFLRSCLSRDRQREILIELIEHYNRSVERSQDDNSLMIIPK